MDWFILLLLLPLVLVPVVLLCGFAGCQGATPCASDADCVPGTRCEEGACVEAFSGQDPPEIPLRPAGLVARAISTSEITLTWENTDPSVPDSYLVERHGEGESEEDFAPIPGAPPVTVETFPDQGLQEGETFFYRVSACNADGCSQPFEGDAAAATTFPVAPSGLIATPIDVDRIDLTWTNNSTISEVEFSLEHRSAGTTDEFLEIYQGPNTTFPHTLLLEGSSHEYRVNATLIGLQAGDPVEVKSSPPATAGARTFAVALQAALTNDQAAIEGFCLIQRIPSALLSSNTAVPNSATQIKITVRGPTGGSLTIDRLYVSRAAAAGDPYDSLPTGVAGGLTRVFDASLGDPPLVLALGSAQTLGPIPFDFLRTEDLLIAMDISPTPGEGNVRFGTGIGASVLFFRQATQQAAVADRPPNAVDPTVFPPPGPPGQHYLIEKIEVS